MTTTVRMILGDVRAAMARLIAAGEQFHFLVTSPPFLAVRDYLPADHEFKADEIGHEPTPGDFLDTLFGLTAQWGELLPKWASIAVELGDTQAGSGGGGGDYDASGWRDGQQRPPGSAKFQRTGGSDGSWSAHPLPNAFKGGGPGGVGWPPAKSACGIPQGYYLGLIYGRNPITGTPSPAGGWLARNWVTWGRPNPAVGALGKRNPDKRTGDARFRPACSFITIACRSGDRYFDLAAVRLEPSSNTHQRLAKGRDPRTDLPSQQRDGNWNTLPAINPRATRPNPRSGTSASEGHRDGARRASDLESVEGGSPPLDWEQELDGDWLWRMGTASYTGSHYAVFPIKLPRRLILAMCPERVCATCGWPSERRTRTVNAVGQAVGRQSWNSDEQTRLLMRGRGELTITANDASVPEHAEVITLGWTDCGHDNWVTGHVLEPFGGSGTTAVAAALEGRDCTMVDLDERNVELVRSRLGEALRVHSEVRDGDTITWTVEAVSDSELRADASGQLDLFLSAEAPPA